MKDVYLTLVFKVDKLSQEERRSLVEKCSVASWSHAIDERKDLEAEMERLQAEVERLNNLADRLKQEAKCHAREARTQRSTVHDIYQALGIPKGDWNGKTPVVDKFAKVEQERDQLAVEVEALTPYRDNHHDLIRHMAEHDANVIERFAHELGVFDREYDDQEYIEVPRYAIKDYANQLRQKAKGE